MTQRSRQREATSPASRLARSLERQRWLASGANLAVFWLGSVAMSEPACFILPHWATQGIQKDGTLLALPDEAVEAMISMVRKAAYGSVTLHFKSGQLCAVETIRKERIGSES